MSVINRIDTASTPNHFRNGNGFVSNFPPELSLHILSFLESADLASFCRVSSRCSQLAENNILWQKLTINKFKIIPHTTISFKRIFKILFTHPHFSFLNSNHYQNNKNLNFKVIKIEGLEKNSPFLAANNGKYVAQVKNGALEILDGHTSKKIKEKNLEEIARRTKIYVDRAASTDSWDTYFLDNGSLALFNPHFSSLLLFPDPLDFENIYYFPFYTLMQKMKSQIASKYDFYIDRFFLFESSSFAMNDNFIVLRGSYKSIIADAETVICDLAFTWKTKTNNERDHKRLVVDCVEIELGPQKDQEELPLNVFFNSPSSFYTVDLKSSPNPGFPFKAEFSSRRFVLNSEATIFRFDSVLNFSFKNNLPVIDDFFLSGATIVMHEDIFLVHLKDGFLGAWELEPTNSAESLSTINDLVT